MGLMHLWLLELKDYATLLSIISLVILYTLFLGLYYAFSGLLYYLTGRCLWLFPFCWILGEWLRTQTIIGNSTGSIGYSQAYNPTLLQWASIGGVFGLSLLLISINILIYLIFTRQKRLYGVIALLFILIFISIGQFMLIRPLSQSDPHTVSIIQANHPQAMKLNRNNWSDIRQSYLELTKDVLQQRPNQLIFWPETITPALNLHQKYLLHQMNTISHRYNTPIIFGSPTRFNDHYFNSLCMMTPDGISDYYYHKTRLMPFGEYWPGKALLKWLGIGQLIPGSEYSPGSNDQLPLIVNDLRIGPGICLESIYPWFYRSMKHKDSDIMLMLANNAWFNDSTGAEKHFQMGIFRAVETQSYFIQASNTGISAIISPKGVSLQQTQLNEQKVITDTVYKVHSKSIYYYIGDLIVYFGMLVIIIRISFGLLK